MKARLLRVSALLAIVGFVAARAQTTQPTENSERLAQVAKDFGMTLEQYQQFIRKEFGEIVAFDDELLVGVQRDDAGRVETVKIGTPKRHVEFNRNAVEGKPAMQYVGGEVAPNVAFASATDFDGDARIDLIMCRTSPQAATTTVLLRIEERFEPATALGQKRYRLNGTGRTVAFDSARHEWTEH